MGARCQCVNQTGVPFQCEMGDGHSGAHQVRRVGVGSDITWPNESSAPPPAEEPCGAAYDKPYPHGGWLCSLPKGHDSDHSAVVLADNGAKREEFRWPRGDEGDRSPTPESDAAIAQDLKDAAEALNHLLGVAADAGLLVDIAGYESPEEAGDTVTWAQVRIESISRPL